MPHRQRNKCTAEAQHSVPYAMALGWVGTFLQWKNRNRVRAGAGLGWGGSCSEELSQLPTHSGSQHEDSVLFWRSKRQTHRHTSLFSLSPSYTHTRAHTQTHTHTHARTHTCMHARTHRAIHLTIHPDILKHNNNRSRQRYHSSDTKDQNATILSHSP